MTRENPATDPMPSESDPRRDGTPKAWYQRIPAPVWSLLALAVGMGLGTVYPTQLAPIGEGVKNTFGYIGKGAPYIIFFTLTPAMVDMMRTGSAAKFAAWVSGAFVLSTIAAALFTLALIIPIFQIPIGADAGDLGGILGNVIEQTLASLLSDAFIAVAYSIFVGFLLHFGSPSRAMGWFCRPTGETFHWIGSTGMQWFGRTIQKAFPAILFAIGVFIPTSVSSTLAQGGEAIAGSGVGSNLDGLSPVQWYFICLGVTVLILFAYLAIFSWLACRVTGFSFSRFVKEYILYVYPFAWATASSTTSIPISLERAREGLGVRSEVRDFIIPMGATVNLDGTIVAIYVITVVAAKLVGFEPTIINLLVLTIPLLIAIIAVPGIPGGVATVAPPIIAAFLGIPDAAVGAFLAIWFGFSIGLSDQFRSGVNTCNNGVISLLFNHYYPRYFEKRVAVPVTGATPTAPEMPELKK